MTERKMVEDPATSAYRFSAVVSACGPDGRLGSVVFEMHYTRGAAPNSPDEMFDAARKVLLSAAGSWLNPGTYALRLIRREIYDKMRKYVDKMEYVELV